MLIVSKFHDYYDSVMATGVDKETVYSRSPAVIELPTIFWRDQSPLNLIIDNHHHGQFTTSVIGFCGKFYPFVSASDGNFFSLPEVEAYLATKKTPKKKYPWTASVFGAFSSIYKGQNFFDVTIWSDHYQHVFKERRAPVFIIRHGNRAINEPRHLIEVNPNLSKYNFQKIKDPYSAYQEIYMYISGVLGNTEKEMVVLSDKDKQKKHGHDGKYSFRKPPAT